MFENLHCTGTQFFAERWRRSEIIEALGDFSNLFGEKSPIPQKIFSAGTSTKQ
jgi:hypothetical protein